MVVVIWVVLALGALAALVIYFMRRSGTPKESRTTWTAWPAALAFFLLYAAQCYTLSVNARVDVP